MRVLFTSFAYFPETSGVPIVVQNLAESLVKRGHQVGVVTCMNGKNLPARETINGVEVIRFNFGIDIFKRPKGDYLSYIEFVKAYPKDILVLECVQCFTTDILLPHLQNMDCKTILHSHGGPGVSMSLFGWEGNVFHSIGHTYNWFFYKYYYGKMIPKYAKYIDKVICLSLCASDLVYMNRTMDDVKIVENAVHDMFFDESLYNIDVSGIIGIKNKDYILCISNYTPNKSQIDILKAFEESSIRDCSLVMIGSRKSSYYNQVKKLAESISERSGKEIKILTGVNRELFPSILHQARLFIMASKHEEYPVSLVESMAVGCPFVSTNAGCSRILPGGVTVVERKDLPLYLNVVANSNDILSRLSKQGKSYALNNNTLDAVVDRFEKELSSVLS